jgi:hypothetical protein
MTTKPTNPIVLLTPDFNPMTGGIAEYLNNLWDEVARHRSVVVMTSIDLGGTKRSHNYRLEQLPRLPRRRLHEKQADKFLPFRKLNTARYFHSLRRYGNNVIRSVPIWEGTSTVMFLGLWGTSHFWCSAFRRSGISYSLHTYGAELVAALYRRLPHWRKEDVANANRSSLAVTGPQSLCVRAFVQMPE